MVLQWWVHGGFMGAPWLAHGGSAVGPSCFRIESMVGHCGSMVLPWWLHGDSVVGPWWVHGAHGGSMVPMVGHDGSIVGPWWVCPGSMVGLWCLSGESIVPLWMIRGGPWCFHVRCMVDQRCFRGGYMALPWWRWAHGASVVGPGRFRGGVGSVVLPWRVRDTLMVAPRCLHGGSMVR